MRVPFVDLRPQHALLKQALLDVWGAILDEAAFVGGPRVTGFEEAFAAACGAGEAVAVSSGTDALLLGLVALGVAPGDEVIVPANTFVATVEAVAHAGGRPVLVDCLPGTWNIDPAAVAAAVTPRTRGVLGVHLYGQPFDVDAVAAVCERHGLWLMEDAAQAHLATWEGRPAGSLGRCAAFSFYPGKNLGAPGEGGALVTSDAALADTVRQLRDHGQAQKYRHERVGYNCRMPALIAAALHLKLGHLPAWTEARRRHAAAYVERLSGTPGVELPVEAAGARSAYHLFVVHVRQRDRVLAALQEAGVGAGMHYPIPCHLQPALTHLGYRTGDFPVTERNAARCLSLPMFAELTGEQIAYVSDVLARAVAPGAR